MASLNIVHFLRGMRCPLRAAAFTLQHPSLWPFCIAPLLINAVLVVLVWYFVGEWSSQWLQHHLTANGWLWKTLHVFAAMFFFLLKLLATLVAFVIVGNIASVPFNDFLSERVDRLVLGWRDERTFRLGAKVRELLLVMVQESLRMTVYLAIMATLFVASFIPVFAPFTTATQLGVSAAFFALDYLAYPLERRGVLLLGRKFAFTREHLAPCMGFGLTMTFVGLIPLVNFLFIPLGVVGGTLLFADISRSSQPDTRELPR